MTIITFPEQHELLNKRLELISDIKINFRCVIMTEMTGRRNSGNKTNDLILNLTPET